MRRLAWFGGLPGLCWPGLLVLTYWVFQTAPIGFIPQQDQGRLIVNVQLPDSASLDAPRKSPTRSRRSHDKVDPDITRRGVAHTVAFSGMSFLLQANSPNFASMFIVLDPSTKRQSPDLRDTAIMAKLRQRWAEEIKDAQVTVYGAAPIPGLGMRRRFQVHRRGSRRPRLAGLADTDRRPGPQMQAQPGLNERLHPVSLQNAATLPRYRPRQGRLAWRGRSNDVNQTLDMYLGSLYVNSFNEFGRHWQVTIQAEGQYRDRDRGH